LIEALSRKGVALCQLHCYNSIYNKEVDNNEKSLEAIDEVWRLLTCFISPDSDSKVSLYIILL